MRWFRRFRTDGAAAPPLLLVVCAVAVVGTFPGHGTEAFSRRASTGTTGGTTRMMPLPYLREQRTLRLVRLREKNTRRRANNNDGNDTSSVTNSNVSPVETGTAVTNESFVPAPPFEPFISTEIVYDGVTGLALLSENCTESIPDTASAIQTQLVTYQYQFLLNRSSLDQTNDTLSKAVDVVVNDLELALQGILADSFLTCGFDLGACSAHPQCTNLTAACCPTSDGVFLTCCELLLLRPYPFEVTRLSSAPFDRIAETCASPDDDALDCYSVDGALSVDFFYLDGDERWLQQLDTIEDSNVAAAFLESLQAAFADENLLQDDSVQTVVFMGLGNSNGVDDGVEGGNGQGGNGNVPTEEPDTDRDASNNADTEIDANVDAKNDAEEIPDVDAITTGDTDAEMDTDANADNEATETDLGANTGADQNANGDQGGVSGIASETTTDNGKTLTIVTSSVAVAVVAACLIILAIFAGRRRQRKQAHCQQLEDYGDNFFPDSIGQDLNLTSSTSLSRSAHTRPGNRGGMEQPENDGLIVLSDLHMAESVDGESFDFPRYSEKQDAVQPVYVSSTQARPVKPNSSFAEFQKREYISEDTVIL
jgi:hypothetical protein